MTGAATPRPKVRRIVTTVREAEGGWLAQHTVNGEEGRHASMLYLTAAETLSALSRFDAAEAEGGISTVRTITWLPATRIGTAIVKAIVGSKTENKRTTRAALAKAVTS